MSATLHSDVYDSGLSVLDVATSTLHICSTQPTTRTEATTTYKLGTKTSLSIGAPQAHTTGRKVAVDYSIDGTTAGPAPLTSMLGRFVGSFSPAPSTANAATSWRMSLNSVALSNKCDYYLFNAATGQSLSSGSVLRAQCWTPG